MRCNSVLTITSETKPRQPTNLFCAVHNCGIMLDVKQRDASGHWWLCKAHRAVRDIPKLYIRRAPDFSNVSFRDLMWTMKIPLNLIPYSLLPDVLLHGRGSGHCLQLLIAFMCLDEDVPLTPGITAIILRHFNSADRYWPAAAELFSNCVQIGTNPSIGWGRWFEYKDAQESCLYPWHRHDRMTR